MLKHTVLFKLHEFKSSEEKNTKIQEIKEGLENLVNKINVLKRLELGVNVNPAENYDLCLQTEFETKEDLAIYASHPEHLKVGELIRACLTDRACVDYEV